jgi:hypothetical protein
MTQEGPKMFVAVSKVVSSAPQAWQKTGLDLVNFGRRSMDRNLTFLNPLARPANYRPTVPP